MRCHEVAFYKQAGPVIQGGQKPPNTPSRKCSRFTHRFPEEMQRNFVRFPECQQRRMNGVVREIDPAKKRKARPSDRVIPIHCDLFQYFLVSLRNKQETHYDDTLRRNHLKKQSYKRHVRKRQLNLKISTALRIAREYSMNFLSTLLANICSLLQMLL